MRGFEAVDCVMSKIEKKRGLVGSSYSIHAPCSTVDARARLPTSRDEPSFVEPRWSRGHVLARGKAI